MLWGGLIYPTICPIFAGGQPTFVTLSLDEKLANDFSDTLLRAEDANITKPVRLIDESNQYVIVLTQNDIATKIDREFVKSRLIMCFKERSLTAIHFLKTEVRGCHSRTFLAGIHVCSS